MVLFCKKGENWPYMFGWLGSTYPTVNLFCFEVITGASMLSLTSHCRGYILKNYDYGVQFSVRVDRSTHLEMKKNDIRID